MVRNRFLHNLFLYMKSFEEIINRNIPPYYKPLTSLHKKAYVDCMMDFSKELLDEIDKRVDTFEIFKLTTELRDELHRL